MSEKRLLNAIAEIESNGLATRAWAAVGVCLGMCGKCPKFTGQACQEHAAKSGRFAELLCDSAFWCKRWRKIHKGEENR